MSLVSYFFRAPYPKDRMSETPARWRFQYFTMSLFPQCGQGFLHQWLLFDLHQVVPQFDAFFPMVLFTARPGIRSLLQQIACLNYLGDSSLPLPPHSDSMTQFSILRSSRRALFVSCPVPLSCFSLNVHACYPPSPMCSWTKAFFLPLPEFPPLEFNFEAF